MKGPFPRACRGHFLAHEEVKFQGKEGPSTSQITVLALSKFDLFVRRKGTPFGVLFECDFHRARRPHRWV